jgi:hypothetical protein
LARSKKERDTCATIVASANGLRFCHPSVRDRPVDTVRRRACDAEPASAVAELPGAPADLGLG